MTDDIELRRRLYTEYDALKEEVFSDPNLSPRERGRAITALTDDLLAKEKEHGVEWTPLCAVKVEASGNGSVEIQTSEITDRR